MAKGKRRGHRIRMTTAFRVGRRLLGGADRTTGGLIVGYALCSSLLSIVNKYAITLFGYPVLLTALQYLASASCVCVLGRSGRLRHDPLAWRTALRFCPAALVFNLAIVTNTNLLLHANVDTFIVFRSATPLLVAVADTAFRGQPCPSRLTFLALATITGGAVGYVATDSAFSLTAYSWATAYLVTITAEMLYIKHVVATFGLSTWGLVLYNNLLSLAMAPALCVLTREYVELASWWTATRPFDWAALAAVSLSCVLGLLISFFGFAARRAVSATAFTVTGVANKFLTVAINVFIWDKHAGPLGLLFLVVTLLGGVMYQQSVAPPSTSAPPPSDETGLDNRRDCPDQEDDEAAAALIVHSRLPSREIDP